MYITSVNICNATNLNMRFQKNVCVFGREREQHYSGLERMDETLCDRAESDLPLVFCNKKIENSFLIDLCRNNPCITVIKTFDTHHCSAMCKHVQAQVPKSTTLYWHVQFVIFAYTEHWYPWTVLEWEVVECHYKFCCCRDVATVKIRWGRRRAKSGGWRNVRNGFSGSVRPKPAEGGEESYTFQFAQLVRRQVVARLPVWERLALHSKENKLMNVDMASVRYRYGKISHS